MKTRQEIKLIAKKAFYDKYWYCVGVNAVVTAILMAAAGTGVGAWVIAGPMTIGLGFFSLCLYRGMSADFNTLFDSGFTNFGRKLGGYLWMQLWIMLWSLLFIVPGIIKALSYAMTPYILGDCPNVKAQDALKLSMRMMNGHKWELFVLGLSFIGWTLLSGLTCGLLSVFYVGPYMNNTYAGYYSELKVACLNSGVIKAEEIA